MENIQPKIGRRSASIVKTRQSYAYGYRDIIEQKPNIQNIGRIIISKSDLDCDMSLLRKLLRRNPRPCLIFLDYDSVRYIDSILDEPFQEMCFLENDGLRISRDYIDLSKLKNIRLSIPLDYLVWGVCFHNKVDTYCFKYNDVFPYSHTNDNKFLSLEDLKKLQKTIKQLSDYHAENDIDKMCLISDYLQSRTQFIYGRESTGDGRCFIAPEFPERCSDNGYIEAVLNSNRGVCMGIANLSTLLLNNPDFDLEVESVNGSHHVWNKILIDGKYYYFDNTWNITRSDTPSADGLITLSFSKKYLLFGDQTATRIGSHEKESEFIYNNGVLSDEDYQKDIHYQSQFVYHDRPKYYTYLKK